LVGIFRIRRNSRILRIFKIHKIRILDLWLSRLHSRRTGQDCSLQFVNMRWVDQQVGLGRDFSLFGGLGWVRSTIAKFERIRIFNAFKARSDKTWLHQAVKFDE